MTGRTALLCTLVLAASVAARAQTAQPAFDVASIRPSPPATVDARGLPVGTRIRIEPGGRLVATTATLRDLLLRAYGLREFQLEGGPAWLNTARFDITATAGGAVPRVQVWQMLRVLLRDRFAVRLRTESREMPIFHLVTARRDGRLGPKLQRSSHECSAALAGRDMFDTSTVEGPEACQPRDGLSVGAGGATARFRRTGVRLSELAAIIAPNSGRMLVDRTGLDGAYDFDLTFSPETATAVFAGGAAPVVAPPPADGTSLQSSLQEQLGLKLEAARGPVEVVVIESAERPAQN